MSRRRRCGPSPQTRPRTRTPISVGFITGFSCRWSGVFTFWADLRELVHEADRARLLTEPVFLQLGRNSRGRLGDERNTREERLSGTGFDPIFPVWGRDTASLAEEMIASGVKAIVTSVNPAVLPPEFAGRWFDRELLADLPPGVDPLGEYGEFHTCVVDGPMLSSRIDAEPGRVVHREIAAPADSGDSAQVRDPHPTCVYADIVHSRDPPGWRGGAPDAPIARGTRG